MCLCPTQSWALRLFPCLGYCTKCSGDRHTWVLSNGCLGTSRSFESCLSVSLPGCPASTQTEFHKDQRNSHKRPQSEHLRVNVLLCGRFLGSRCWQPTSQRATRPPVARCSETPPSLCPFSGHFLPLLPRAVITPPVKERGAGGPETKRTSSPVTSPGGGGASRAVSLNLPSASFPFLSPY